MSYKKKDHVVKTLLDQEKISTMVIPAETSQKALLNAFDSSRVQLEYTGDQIDYSYTSLGEQVQMLKEANKNTELLKSGMEQFIKDQEYLSNWNTTPEVPIETQSTNTSTNG
jgi:hypothetical protein